MSKLSEELYTVFKQLFPEITVKREKHVDYKKQRLFLDFWVPKLSMVIEVHGRQHREFVRHFHEDIAGFRASKKRDALKAEWAAQAGLTMVVIWDDEFPLTKEFLLTRIKESMDADA